MSVDACPGIGQRAVGAYLGLAVGDALGATVEFLTPREIRERYGVHRDICGGGWPRLKPGQVTDDTQMSLALGDAILNSRVENPGGWIVETLQAVFQALFSNHGFESILVDVVNRGGDADTTGAIAGMLAGAYCGPDAIPDRWLGVLDDDTRKACRKQALDLISLAGQLVH